MEFKKNYKQLISIKRIKILMDELYLDWQRELTEKPLSDIGISDYERKKLANATSTLVVDYLNSTDFKTFPPDSEKIHTLLDTIKLVIGFFHS
jgi:hypothetical protein